MPAMPTCGPIMPKLWRYRTASVWRENPWKRSIELCRSTPEMKRPWRLPARPPFKPAITRKPSSTGRNCLPVLKRKGPFRINSRERKSWRLVEGRDRLPAISISLQEIISSEERRWRHVRPAEEIDRLPRLSQRERLHAPPRRNGRRSARSSRESRDYPPRPHEQSRVARTDSRIVEDCRVLKTINHDQRQFDVRNYRFAAGLYHRLHDAQHYEPACGCAWRPDAGD